MATTSSTTCGTATRVSFGATGFVNPTAQNLILRYSSLTPGHERKSNLMNDIAVNVENDNPTGDTLVGVKTMIIDAMVIVQSLEEIRRIENVLGYRKNIHLQIVSGCRYIIIAFDTYKDPLLKEAARIRRKSHNPPAQFRVDDNTELKGNLRKFH